VTSPQAILAGTACRCPTKANPPDPLYKRGKKIIHKPLMVEATQPAVALETLTYKFALIFSAIEPHLLFILPAQATGPDVVREIKRVRGETPEPFLAHVLSSHLYFSAGLYFF
jgi:hypothetical protein